MKRMQRSFLAGMMIIVMFMMHAKTKAQLAVNLQLQPSGIIQKQQLWNIAVVNGSSERIPMLIELNVFDSRNGNRVFSSVSKILIIAQGAKQITIHDVMPIQYQYLNPLYQIDASQNSLLPVGVFRFCYNFFRTGDKGSELLLEECRTMEVGPLSPPMLNLPQDSAVLSNKHPQFVWIPPVPLQTFKNLNYELRVVELQKGQNSSEALQKNLPFAEKGNIREPYFSYPSSLPAFDTATMYAWQITAYDANGYSVKSEVWSFSIKNRNPSGLKLSTAYVWLKQGEDPSMFVSSGHVKFSYENMRNDSLVTYRVVAGNKEQQVRQGSIKLSPGQNFIDLDFGNKRFWRENETYRFELINSKGERWKLSMLFIEKEEE
ncbi:MAG: hypothetical protein KGZ74_15120 [Chitinophagaceae bacterium]|nr:hypothetical protein [Chitinophagaceae bacterium]